MPTITFSKWRFCSSAGASFASFAFGSISFGDVSFEFVKEVSRAPDLIERQAGAGSAKGSGERR